MVLTIIPALDGLRRQWREAAQNNGAGLWQYWRYVGPAGADALRCSAASCCSSARAFAAYATAAAMVGASVPLITLQIADVLNGNVSASASNVALAMSLNMVIISVLVMALYLPLQRRSARWLDRDAPSTRPRACPARRPPPASAKAGCAASLDAAR